MKIFLAIHLFFTFVLGNPFLTRSKSAISMGLLGDVFSFRGAEEINPALIRRLKEPHIAMDILFTETLEQTYTASLGFAKKWASFGIGLSYQDIPDFYNHTLAGPSSERVNVYALQARWQNGFSPTRRIHLGYSFRYLHRRVHSLERHRFLVDLGAVFDLKYIDWFVSFMHIDLFRRQSRGEEIPWTAVTGIAFRSKPFIHRAGSVEGGVGSHFDGSESSRWAWDLSARIGFYFVGSKLTLRFRGAIGLEGDFRESGRDVGANHFRYGLGTTLVWRGIEISYGFNQYRGGLGRHGVGMGYRF